MLTSGSISRNVITWGILSTKRFFVKMCRKCSTESHPSEFMQGEFPGSKTVTNELAEKNRWVVGYKRHAQKNGHKYSHHKSEEPAAPVAPHISDTGSMHVPTNSRQLCTDAEIRSFYAITARSKMESIRFISSREVKKSKIRPVMSNSVGLLASNWHVQTVSHQASPQHPAAASTPPVPTPQPHTEANIW